MKRAAETKMEQGCTSTLENVGATARQRMWHSVKIVDGCGGEKEITEQLLRTPGPTRDWTS